MISIKRQLPFNPEQPLHGYARSKPGFIALLDNLEAPIQPFRLPDQNITRSAPFSE